MQYITLPGVPNGLHVNDLPTVDRSHDGLWKVSHVYDETPRALSGVVFARRTDAERAKAALDSIVDWSDSPREVVKRLREKGWTQRAVTQLMAESVQW